MKSMSKHSIILLVFFVASSLYPDTNARPNGATNQLNQFNQLFTVLAPSATGKPGTGDYTARDFVNDGMKNNLAFLNEVCPPLARIADQLCQAVQNIVQRCINLIVGGGNVPKGGDTTTTQATDSGSSTESTAEETTPSSGSGYDNSNPKFGGDQSTSSESSETSSENSTDKPGDTTTAKQ